MTLVLGHQIRREVVPLEELGSLGEAYFEPCYLVDSTFVEVDRPLVEQQTLVVLFQVVDHLAEFSSLVRQSLEVADSLEREVKMAFVAFVELACLDFEAPSTLVEDVG